MPPRSQKNKRLRRNDLARILLADIVAGKFGPGELIPTRTELLKRFDVAPATLQAAMDILIAENFITVSASRYGTRVAEYPPHLYNYTMVLPPSPHFASQYYKALTQQAEKITATGPQRINIFEGVAGHDDFERYHTFADDVRFRRIKGIFFTTGATEYQNTLLLTQPDMPRFAVAENYELPGVSKASFDQNVFFKRAASYLKAQGRQRPAVLGHSAFNPAWLQNPILQSIRKAELKTESHLVQFADVAHPIATAQAMRLLLELPPARRPDSLIIADDNLVEPATQVLKDAGSALGSKFLVVAHANFPTPTTSHVPAKRLGFDIAALLNLAIQAIDNQYEGKSVPMFQAVSPVFEDELTV